MPPSPTAIASTRELGAGGMATVYLAHDLKHERDVAIKVLHPDLGAALGGERFLSEIRTTARCSIRTFCRCSTAEKRMACCTT
jgi:serine/threonine protein kinase